MEGKDERGRRRAHQTYSVQQAQDLVWQPYFVALMTVLESRCMRIADVVNIQLKLEYTQSAP